MRRRPLILFWLLTVGTPVVVGVVALLWHGSPRLAIAGLILGSSGLLGGAATALWIALTNRVAVPYLAWCVVVGGPLTLVSAVLFGAVEGEAAIPVGQFLGLMVGFGLFSLGAICSELKPRS